MRKDAYRYRRTSVGDREAAQEARINYRMRGGHRLAETALDGLQALHGIVAMKVQNTPSMAFAAHRILSSVEMASDELILRYMLG